MRGDSLRDLYAKTIALLGLALVGALGALVDYWPAAQPMPRVAGRLAAPAPAGVAARADLAAVDSVVVLAAPSSTERRPAVARRQVRPPALPVRVASVTEVLSTSASVTFEAPARPVPSLAVQPLTTLHTSQVALVAPELTPEVPVVTFAQHASGQGPADQGFLTDATEAAKKAGNTIVASTVKTGASIVDGLRSFGGVVRRGLWRF